jgi:hypothetical protein
LARLSTPKSQLQLRCWETQRQSKSYPWRRSQRRTGKLKSRCQVRLNWSKYVTPCHRKCAYKRFVGRKREMLQLASPLCNFQTSHFSRASPEKYCNVPRGPKSRSVSKISVKTPRRPVKSLKSNQGRQDTMMLPIS